jgi:hypothetical protein
MSAPTTLKEGCVMTASFVTGHVSRPSVSR